MISDFIKKNTHTYTHIFIILILDFIIQLVKTCDTLSSSATVSVAKVELLLLAPPAVFAPRQSMKTKCAKVPLCSS